EPSIVGLVAIDLQQLEQLRATGELVPYALAVLRRTPTLYRRQVRCPEGVELKLELRRNFVFVKVAPRAVVLEADGRAELRLDRVAVPEDVLVAHDDLRQVAALPCVPDLIMNLEDSRIDVSGGAVLDKVLVIEADDVIVGDCHEARGHDRSNVADL